MGKKDKLLTKMVKKSIEIRRGLDYLNSLEKIS